MLAGLIALGFGPQLGVNAAISQLEAGDQQAIVAAKEMLKARGQEVVPVLLKTLHDNPSCATQINVADVLRDLQPESPVPNATLLSIVQTKCKTKPQLEALYRRQAAFALVSRADGLPTILGLLKGGDSNLRHAASAAFFDLMKSLSSGTPKVDLTPALVDAAKTAMEALVNVLKDSDQYVRCGAYDTLTEAQKAPSDELKQQATKLIEGVPKPKCDFK
jgi:HEAT repeat protein